mgnify:CR=1 FL=1
MSSSVVEHLIYLCNGFGFVNKNSPALDLSMMHKTPHHHLRLNERGIFLQERKNEAEGVYFGDDSMPALCDVNSGTSQEESGE